jgi:SAM-dependent methyltransferase
MNKIELLSPKLLENRRLLREVKSIARQLVLKLGWHYYLDLIWTRMQLPADVKDLTILDVGAGRGLMQWMLAAEGATVISLDKNPAHSAVPRRFLQWCNVEGFYRDELVPPNDHLNLRSFCPIPRARFWKGWPDKIRKTGLLTKGHKGKVRILNDDARFLDPEALSPRDRYLGNPVDFIVSISALEHNSPEVTAAAVENLLKIVRPGGKLIATVCAHKDVDCYNEKYNTHNLTLGTLMEVFQISGRENLVTNWDQYDEIFADLVNCEALRKRPVYWNPTYTPVGIVKTRGE